MLRNRFPLLGGSHLDKTSLGWQYQQSVAIVQIWTKMNELSLSTDLFLFLLWSTFILQLVHWRTNFDSFLSPRTKKNSHRWHVFPFYKTAKSLYGQKMQNMSFIWARDCKSALCFRNCEQDIIQFFNFHLFFFIARHNYPQPHKIHYH